MTPAARPTLDPGFSPALVDTPPCSLARWATDRDAARRREPGLLGVLIAEGARVVAVDRHGRVALAGEGPEAALADLRAGDLPWQVALDRCAYLGCAGEEHWVGLWLTEGEAAALEEVPGQPRHLHWASLREVGAALSARDAGLAAPAVALAAWHPRARFCGACGSPTEPIEAGWVRCCTGCGELIFPRTDPAVIMAVTDEADRIVLVHGRTWAPGRYSVVAGFVEAGESAEAAVVREVGEEVGLQVAHVEPVATQPWPFPRSLMLGFRARLAPGQPDPIPDGEEVTSALILSREELTQAVKEGRVTLPGRASIARMLLEDWFGSPLGEE